MTVRLHIERLVLDGLPMKPGNHTALLEAVLAELSLQLSQLDLSGLQAARYRSLQLREVTPSAAQEGIRPLSARIAATALQALTPLQMQGSQERQR